MFKFFLSKVILMFVIMFVVSSITFFIIRWLPGDPVHLWVGDHPTKEQLYEARKKLGFNEPIHKQYLSFLKKTAVLDLGISLRTKQPVLVELKNRFSATFELVSFSIFFAFLLGFPLGVLSALNVGTVYDYIVRGAVYFGLSLPVFWLAMVLQLVFFGFLQWLPLQGRYAGLNTLESQITYNSGFLLVDSFFSGDWVLFYDALKHIALPSLTMSIGVLGIVVRTTRSAISDVMRNPFFITYASYGFKNHEIIRYSAYKNALVPVSTVAGLSFGLMLGGTFLVESIFDWPGLGHFSVLSILTSDFPAIIGVTLLYAFIYVIINFLIDIFYAFIDPRIDSQS